MREGEYPAKAADPCGWYFQARALAYAVGGPIALLLLLALFVVGCRAAWPRSLPLLVLGLAWYLMIGATGVRYARYALPLVPLLAIGAASALGTVSRLKPLLPGAAAAVCVLLGFVASVVLSGSPAFRPEPREVALRQIAATAPPGERLGVIRTIWFDMPPLDFNNGGDALGGRFTDLRRSVRPLTVIPDFDAPRLRAERPEWFVETDFQLADWLRAGNPAAEEFRRALDEHYVLQATYQRRLGWFPTAAWGPVPHDFSYPFTTIRLWRLKAPKDTSTPPANLAP